MAKSAVGPAVSDGREHSEEARHPALLIHVVAALAVVATVVGRALAPALPGSVAGISRIIRVADLFGNLLTQLFAFAGISCALLLSRIILQSKKKDLVFKLLVLPVTLLIGFMVMVKMRVTGSDPNGSMTLALTSSGLALAAAPTLLRNEATRAMALGIALAGAGGALHGAARYLAFQASLGSLPTQFLVARAAESVAFVLHMAVIVLALIWLKSRGPAFPAKALSLAALALLVAVAAERGSMHHASVWEVLASRSLGRLLTDPLPFLPALFTKATTVLTLAVSAWLIASRRPDTTALVFCFCLLSGGSTDVPLLALALALATIIAKLPPPQPPAGTPSRNIEASASRER